MKRSLLSLTVALLLFCSGNARATTEEADAWMRYLFGESGAPLESFCYRDFHFYAIWQEYFEDIPTNASFEDAVKLAYAAIRRQAGATQFTDQTASGEWLKKEFGFTNDGIIPPDKSIVSSYPRYFVCKMLSIDNNDFIIHCEVIICGGIGYVPSDPINLGDCEECNANKPSTAVGNPINILTGNKFQKETDVPEIPGISLGLQRFYNSGDFAATAFGAGWRNTYERVITKTAEDRVTASRADGRVDPFTLVSDNWQPGTDVTSQLTALLDAENQQTGWKLARNDDSVEIYTLDGRLTSIASRAGLTTSLSYDADDRLSTVAGPFGHTFVFSYDAAGHISRITDPGGGQYQYAYDANNNLVSVTYPDGKSRQYHYEVPLLFVNDLTGITDENGVRFATYAYDCRNRVVSSEHAGGKDRISIDYDSSYPYTATDALNNATSYGYSDQTPLRKLADKGPADGSYDGDALFQYDENGFLIEYTDQNGTDTTFTRDTRGLELTRTEASGTYQARTITTAWHSTFHLPLTITEPNRKTAFTYDGKGNLLNTTTTAGGKSRSWSYTYNTNGQVLTKTDPLGNVTTYTYNGQGGVATITNALGHVTRITNYDANGRPLRIADPNGLVTSLAYDARGRLTTQTCGAEVTRYTYDAVGQLTRVTLPNGAFLAFSYDAAHRLTAISDTLGNRIAYTLDAMGNRTKEEVFDASNNLRRTRSMAYDSLNRLWKTIGARNQKTTRAYDNNSNITSVTDPLNNVTQHSYDSFNRLIQTIDPKGQSSFFAYNENDLTVAVTDTRTLVTHYTYDGLENLSGTESPDAGATTRTFDAAGNVLTETDARGKTTTHAYDALNRVVGTTFADGKSISYQYDQGTNGIGRLTRITDAVGSTGWVYDIQGRVLEKRQQMGSATLTTSYQYDSTTGNLMSLTCPSGRVISYVYGNSSGLPTEIRLDGNTLLNAMEYEPFGRLSSWRFGNGSSHVRTYDQDGRIVKITATVGSGIAIDYTYDAAGRITNISGSNQAPNIDAGSSNHLYPGDSNRLTGSTGNWAQTYTYDAAGNLIQDGAYTYTYDARGRLAQVVSGGSSTEYGINGLGQRVRKTASTGTTIFVYDEAGHLLGEYEADRNAIQETVWLGDMPVGVLKGSARYYINPDHLGAPHSITDQAGTVVWKWPHDPYGNGQPEQLSGQTFVYNLRFPGQYHDAESGLNYNYYRDYNPMVGRYVQSDPIGLAGGLNTYAYGIGNPVSNVDLDGKEILSKVEKAITIYKRIKILLGIKDVYEASEKNKPDDDPYVCGKMLKVAADIGGVPGAGPTVEGANNIVVRPYTNINKMQDSLLTSAQRRGLH